MSSSESPNSISSTSSNTSRSPHLPVSHTQSSVGMLIKKSRARKPVNCSRCRKMKKRCDKQQPCSSCVKSNLPCYYGSSDESKTTLGDVMSDRYTGGNHEPLHMDQINSRDSLGDLLQISDGSNSAELIKKMKAIILSLLNEREKYQGHTQAKSQEKSVPDDQLASLSDSLGLLKLDKTGKSIYHGDTHWGLIFREAVEGPAIFNQFKERFQANMQAANINCMTSDEKVSVSGGGAVPFNGAAYAIHTSQILEAIPAREVCDLLIERYFEAVNPVFHIVHRPTFEISYEKFWRTPAEVELLWMALLFGILSVALKSYSKERIPDDLIGTDEELLELWLKAIDYCSYVGKITKKPSLINVRIFYLWMLCQNVSDWTAECWPTFGLVSQVLLSMGMHRDPKWFAFSPFEREQRRQLWAQAELFNSLLAISEGLPMTLQENQSDVEDPSNLNDDEITVESVSAFPDKSLRTVTDTSFLILQRRLNKMLSKSYAQSLNIERAVTYSEVLDDDQNLRDRYEELKVHLDQSNTSEAEFKRFLFEMLFLKGIVVMHRYYSVRSRHDSRYRRSRQEILKASKIIIDKHNDIFINPDKASVRDKFLLLINFTTFSYYVHAIMFVCINLVVSVDFMDTESKRSHISSIYKARVILESWPKMAGFQSSDFMTRMLCVMISHVLDVIRLSREERRSTLKVPNEVDNTFNGKQSAIMMELNAKDTEKSLGNLDEGTMGKPSNVPHSHGNLSRDSSTTGSTGLSNNDGITTASTNNVSPDSLFGESEAFIDDLLNGKRLEADDFESGVSFDLLGDLDYEPNDIGIEEWDEFIQNIDDFRQNKT